MRKASDISIATIIESVEGPIAMTQCALEGDDHCKIEHLCSVKPHWTLISLVIRKALDQLTLHELIQPISSNGIQGAEFEKVWDTLFPNRTEGSNPLDRKSNEN